MNDKFTCISASPSLSLSQTAQKKIHYYLGCYFSRRPWCRLRSCCTRITASCATQSYGNSGENCQKMTTTTTKDEHCYWFYLLLLLLLVLYPILRGHEIAVPHWISNIGRSFCDNFGAKVKQTRKTERKWFKSTFMIPDVTSLHFGPFYFLRLLTVAIGQRR